MRTRSPLLTAAVVWLVLSLVGCYSAVKTRRIPMAAKEEVSGLAVNYNTPHRVVAVFPEKQGSSKLVMEHARAMLPDARAVYEVNYTGALFRSRELAVSLHADTTVKKIEIGDALTLPEDLAAMREGVAALAPVKKAFDEAAEAKQPPTAAEVLTLENAALQAQILNAMLQANLDAVAKGGQPPYPDAGP